MCLINRFHIMHIRLFIQMNHSSKNESGIPENTVISDTETAQWLADTINAPASANPKLREAAEQFAKVRNGEIKLDLKLPQS